MSDPKAITTSSRQPAGDLDLPSARSSALEHFAEQLEASGDYRVLRRLTTRTTITPPDGTPTRSGLFVDVETTGLDAQKDEIIELAMVPFTYGLNGSIFEVGKAYQQFQEPIAPIDPAITAITGITDTMVAGQRIDPNEVKAFASNASLVIAHNAAFDRRFVEPLSDVFVSKPWACSMTQVNWASEGYEGTKLAYLVAGAGFFYDRHRAENDCRAAIELLAMPLPNSGIAAMARLLEVARQSGWRIWAENAPFDLKDILKARGYRWNGDDNLNPRAWYIDVDDHQRETEIDYLRKEIYRREVDLPVHKIDAYNRFSDRL